MREGDRERLLDTMAPLELYFFHLVLFVVLASVLLPALSPPFKRSVLYARK